MEVGHGGLIHLCGFGEHGIALSKETSSFSISVHLSALQHG